MRVAIKRTLKSGFFECTLARTLLYARGGTHGSVA